MAGRGNRCGYWAWLALLGGLAATTVQAQTAEEAARFVFENATINPGSVTVFNADGQLMDVRLGAPCQIVLTRNTIVSDVRVGPPGWFGAPGKREESNPRPMPETAVIQLGLVQLRTGTVTTQESDGQSVSRFQFLSDSGAVKTHTVRLTERPDGDHRWILPDGYEDLAWPNLSFSVVELGEKAGRFKTAFEYLIGRFCAGKSSAY